MNERFVSIIKHILENKIEFSQNDIAKKIGISSGYISQIANEQRKVSKRTVNNLMSSYDIFNREWLLTGKGEMLKSATTAPITQTVNGVGNNGVQINTMDKALDEIAAQRKLTEDALKLNTKSQEQIDRLLNLLEHREK